MCPTNGDVHYNAYRRKRRCFLAISSPIDTSKYSKFQFIYKYIVQYIIINIIFYYYCCYYFIILSLLLFFSFYIHTYIYSGLIKIRPVFKIIFYCFYLITYSRSLANNFWALEVLSVFHSCCLNNWKVKV